MFASVIPSVMGSVSPLAAMAGKRVVCASPKPQQFTRNMATLKDIKLRIKSVSSIAKLTKTMQMVASSKLRASMRKVQETKDAANSLNKITSIVDNDKSRGSNLIVAVTSDKGMCGPINNQVVRFAKGIIRHERDASKLDVTTLGGKGTSSMAAEFPKQLTFSMKDFGKKEYSFMEVGFVVDKILSHANYESVSVIFNKFKNALTYTVTEVPIPGPGTMLANQSKFALYEFDQDEDATFRDLFEYQISLNIWSALMENRASELAARMTSMDNATKNASSIISLLGIQYNRGRQAAITTELIEITSGASALVDAEDEESM